MNKSPVIGTIPQTNKPVIPDSKRNQQHWSFSFRYYNQVPYFGLGGVSTKWFISLLERLRDLCKEDINNFFKDHRIKEANRYHKINWDAINIPIKRNEINWLDKNIIDNEDDYPFFQFQISTGLGRVIGFWNEDYKFFNIVLLDPKHNMQPSKDFDYKVDDTTIEPCEYTSLLNDIDNIKGLKCLLEGCQCKEELNKVPTRLNRGKFVYFQIEDDYYDEFLEKTKYKSIKEIIELGLLSD